MRSSAVYAIKPSLWTGMKPCSVKVVSTNGCIDTVPGSLYLTMRLFKTLTYCFFVHSAFKQSNPKIIEKMKATIAALKEEVKELHRVLERSKATSDHK